MRNGNVFRNGERVRNWTLRTVDFFHLFSGKSCFGCLCNPRSRCLFALEGKPL